MKVTATIRTMSDVDALRTAVVLAVERLCFASADSFSAELPPGESIDASVAFRGSVSGAVSVAIPPETLRGFAETFLPPDAPDQAVDLADFVSELANIVCGNVVPRIFGRAEVYELSPPQLARSTKPAIATAVVNFDGGWVAAILHGAES
jgi:CheY-specific phosphatase CheX